MEIEPNEVVFREVRLHQAYVHSLCITNRNIGGPIDINIKATADRYSITPSKVHLQSGQSIVLTIRLFVSHFPNYAQGVKGQEDYLIFQTPYSEQRIPVRFYLVKRDTVSMSTASAIKNIKDAFRTSERHQQIDQQQQQHLQSNKSMIDGHNVQQLLEDREDEHKLKYEQRSKQVLVLLKKKDENIALLTQKNNEMAIQLENLKAAMKDLERDSGEYKQLYESEKQKVTDLQSIVTNLNHEVAAFKHSSQPRKEFNEIDNQIQLTGLLSENNQLKSQLEALMQELSATRDNAERRDSLLVNNLNKWISDLQNQNILLEDQLAELERSREMKVPDSTVEVWRYYKQRAELLEADLLKLSIAYDDICQRHLNYNKSEAVESKQDEKNLATKQQNVNQDQPYNESIEQHSMPDSKNIREVQFSNKDYSSDANMWWKYVWFEVNKRFDNQLDPIREQSSLEEDCQNTCRQQAVEIVKLKQENVMTTIKYQKDMSKEISMKEELTQEIQKLKHFIAKSKRDSEITHSELNAALKSLSTRSDLHSELLSCRQELASEKLVSQGLRVNCELQRSVLEEERAKNILLKQELHEVTNTLQSIQMTNSIENIPGANPLEVMKLFSGRIVWLENELKAFQRRESNMVALSQISSEQSSYANKQVKSIKSRNKIERPQSKEGVIDFLNDALHAQMLNHQETVIAEQKEKISQLEQEISRMILDVDVFSIENETECGLGVQWQKLKLERDASEKRLELLNQQLEASKSEIATLRITIVSLEKKLQANESRQNLDYRNSFDLHPTTDVNQQQSLEDKEANQTLHDLLQERTYQVKVLMESLETIQTNEVTNSKKLAFTDAAHYDKGDIPYQPAAAHGSSSLIKRIVDLSVEMASQSTLCFAAERRCDQLENIVVHKSKEITDLKNNISRLTTELTSLRRQHVEQFSSFSEKSENQSSEIFDLKEQICKLQEIIVEYETKCGDLEVSQNELFAQAELADRAAFQKWFLENLVPTEFDDTHSSDLSPAIYDQRAHLSKSDQHKSVEDLVVKLLVQWREQVGFYPRGASGPISKAEEKFLNQITSLVLEAHQVSKNATIESIRSRNEADKSSRLYHRLIKRYEIAVREIYSLRSRLEVSEKILLIDQLYALRGNGKLCNFLTSKLESMTTKLSECRKQLEVAVKQNDQLKLQLNDSNSTNDGLQIKIANLEAFGLNYYRLRDEAIEFAEKSIEQFEKNLKTWFKAEFPRIASGFPIAEMDLQFDWNCNYLEDGGESPFESRSVRMQATGPQSQITIAHALLESRVSNSKTIMLKQNWRDKELLYKERIYHLESIINQWQQSHIPVVKDTDIRNIFENADSIELLSVQNQRLEELCSQLKNSNDHLTDRCNLMKGMIDELKKAERELNLHYADKITEQAKNLESRHAVELKDLREAYEKEKISIVEEIYKVSTNVEGPVLTEETMYELLPTKVPASIELNFNDSTHTDNDTRNSHAQPQQPQQMSQATSKHKVVEITSPSRKPSTPATLNPSKTNQKKENNDLNELIGKYNALLQEYQLEKEGNSQMKLQVAELEQLLESQRLSFLRHLEIEKNFVNSSCAVPSNGSNVSTNGSLDAVTVDTEPLQLTEESSSSRVDCDIKSVESMLEVLTCHSAEINVKMTELIKCLQTYSINDTLADQITESIRMIRNVAEEFNSVLQKVSHNVSELPDSNHHHKIEKNDDELHARLQLYENLLSELRVENTSNMNNLKTKYEAALQDLQGMMNEQLTVAKMEIDRLQNALSLGSPTAAAVMVDSFSQTDFVEEKHEHLKTILELQRLLDSAADEIDNYKLREKVLTSELLQHQERENRENAVKNQNPQANENVKQLESKLGELTRMCEEKTIELKQLLKATSLVDRKDPTFPFDATIIQQPTFNDQASAVINEQLREQLRQANSQIETLTKKISTLEQDEKRRREFGNVDIENRTRLQRSREVESMKTEIQKLRDEKVNFKQILDEYKAQVNGLREENTRKIGLITSLKSARESDLNALETWKHNLSEMEEKNKRLQRALQSKEEIVKDLKQKMTALETSAVVQQESDGSDLTTLTISQLRTRVKAAELERGRARARISAYREKVDELEANIRKLQQEIEHCKGFEDKCEILKQNIVRKDSQIKSLHEQVEKLKVDNLANKEITTTRISDLERMLRNARRQIEASESKQEEYQQKILDVKNDHLSKVDELRRECSSLEVLNANLKSQVASLSSHLKSDSERALGVGGGEGESFHHDRISTSELEDIISAISVDSKESRSTRYRSELKDATKLKEAEDSLKSLLQFVT